MPLAAARLGAELTFDALGTADPHGWAVSHPVEADPTAVNDPVVATAPGGAAATSSSCPAPWMGSQPPIPLRVSRMRVGTAATNEAPPDPKRPCRSTITRALADV